MKVFCIAFMCLQFGFVILGQKEIGSKVAHKMLVKLTTGDNQEPDFFQHCPVGNIGPSDLINTSFG